MRAAPVLLAAVAAGVLVTGCQPVGPAARSGPAGPAGPAGSGGPVAGPVAGPAQPAVQPASSALVVALDPADPEGSAATARSLLVATGVPGEQAAVICGGQLVGSAAYPDPSGPGSVGSAPTLPAGATEFQRRQYDQKVARYRERVAAAASAAAGAQRAAVQTWVAGLVARRSACPRGEGDLTRAAIDRTAVTFSGWSQAGLDLGPRRVLALEGPMTGRTDLIGESLPGVTAVLPGFAGDARAQAAWRARLQGIGVSHPVVLDPGAGAQATREVAAALRTEVAVPSAGAFLFGLDSAALTPGAKTALEQMLRLLTVRYPDSQATVDGYADSLGDPTRNRELSQQRAEAVVGWLVAHGVASSRLTAYGYGADDPQAPNGPAGQPANRRTVLIIDVPL